MDAIGWRGAGMAGWMLLLPAQAFAAAACPPEFPGFVARFQRDASFRDAHTRFPLAYSRIDKAALPEPRPVLTKVPRRAAGRYPAIRWPSAEVQASIPLERTVFEGARRTRILRFAKPGSDTYSVGFHFAWSRGCWRLVKVEDTSL